MSTHTTVSLRLNEEDNKLIRAYAEIRGITVSEFLREAALDEIKRELDILFLEDAYKQHLKKTQVLSKNELRKRLGLL